MVSYTKPLTRSLTQVPGTVEKAGEGPVLFPPPGGSAFYLDFRHNVAWEGSTRLGNVAELISGSLKLVDYLWVEEHGDDYLLHEDIIAIAESGTGSFIVEAAELVKSGGTNYGRILGINTGLFYFLGTDTDQPTNRIGAWDGARYPLAEPGAGDFSGLCKFGVAFDGNGLSICFNGGDVSSEAEFAIADTITQLWLGGDGGGFTYTLGKYYSLTAYDSRLSDEDLQLALGG